MKDLQRITQNEIERVQNRPRMSQIYCVIFVILILLGLNISFETYADMDKEFSITDSQSRDCLVEFQTKKCDALKLNDECQEIFDCIQKEHDANLVQKTTSFLEFLTDEIQ